MIPVLHMIDSLALAGAERAAVNIANALPRDRFESHLCATRREGALREEIAPHVALLSLGRRRRLDAAAFRRLAVYIQAHRIRLIHAHSSSLFIGAAVSMLPPYPKLIWHDHFGRYATEERSRLIYGLAVRRAAGVIAVNQPLAAWSRDRLRVPPERVWYIPNFAVVAGGEAEPGDLPGTRDTRIVCVANLRPQKDHRTLIHAMANLHAQIADAHLLLVGAGDDGVYKAQLEDEIVRCGLVGCVHLLGERRDVPNILRHSAVGVLSSSSEGLPLSLIEYGAAGLASVATRVGQCPEVLDEGRAGRLVAPGDAAALGAALMGLMRAPGERRALGVALRARVESMYSQGVVMGKIVAVYDQILKP
jgi:glycosyltransferase involved in cell wall biosynthesis